MNKLFPVILIMISIKSVGQTDSIKLNADTIGKTTIETEQPLWRPDFSFTLEAGCWFPLGNLRSTFKTNPNFCLAFGFPVSKNLRVDLGSSVFIPVNSERIDYIKQDTTIRGKLILSGVLGLWVTRGMHLWTAYSYEIRLGSGVGFLQTNIPTNKPKEDNDSVYGLETIYLNVGGTVKRVIFKWKYIGINLSYYYIPYRAFSKHVYAHFGNSNLTTGIIFQF